MLSLLRSLLYTGSLIVCWELHVSSSALLRLSPPGRAQAPVLALPTLAPTSTATSLTSTITTRSKTNSTQRCSTSRTKSSISAVIQLPLSPSANLESSRTVKREHHYHHDDNDPIAKHTTKRTCPRSCPMRRGERVGSASTTDLRNLTCMGIT